MINIIISILIIVGFITLSILGDKNPKKITAYKNVNLIFGIVGIILFAGAYFFGRFTITSVSRDATWVEWAGNMFGIYFSLALPLFAICLGAITIYYLISLVQKKKIGNFQIKIRKIFSLVSSAAMLTLAVIYAPIIANKIFPLDVLVFIAGIGQALAMRLTYVLEYTVKKN